MSPLYRAHQRDAVYYTPVEHRHTVYVNNLAHVWQTARCHHDIDKTLLVLSLREITRSAGKTIRCNHLKLIGIVEVCIVIIRQQLFGKIFVKKLAVDDASLREEVAQTDVFILEEKIDV